MAAQLHEPTAAQQAARLVLTRRVADAVLDAEDASDAVSACLSVACAYLRVIDRDQRMEITEGVTDMMVRYVQDSLNGDGLD